MSVCERGAHSPIPVSDREPWMRIQCRGALLRRVNYALSLRWRGMGNASHGCCGQRFNFLIRAIFSCIHPKHLQGHTKTLAFSRREGFFLDFNRREEINGRGFLGRCRTAGDSHPSLPAAAELGVVAVQIILAPSSPNWWDFYPHLSTIDCAARLPNLAVCCQLPRLILLLLALMCTCETFPHGSYFDFDFSPSSEALVK